MNEIQEKDNVIIRLTNTFHDKFIGKKCFALNRIKEEKIIKDLKTIFKHFKRKI